MTLPTQADVRISFWEAHPQFTRQVRRASRSQSGRITYVEKRQNNYPPEVREAFVNYVDYLYREGSINTDLADKVTL